MFAVALAEVQKFMVNFDPENPKGEAKLEKKKLIRSLWPDLKNDEQIGKQHYQRLKEYKELK